MAIIITAKRSLIVDSIMKAEAELLKSSLKGNREAFGAIVERYQSLICSITYSASGNQARSEELAQEVFVRAWKGLGQLKDVSNFRAWICTIARNLVSKHIIKEQKDMASRAMPLEQASQVVSSESAPVDRAVSKEHEDLVWGALESIPQLYREPLVLFYREQQSVNQVAADLELSEDAVKKRLSRGRKLLRAEVASLVKDVIGRTRPSRTFTVAIVASLPAIDTQAAGAAIATTATKSFSLVKSIGVANIIGSALGHLLVILGSLIYIRASISSAKSDRERAFMKKRLIIALLYCSIGMAIVIVLWWRIPWISSRIWPLLTLFGIYFIGVLLLAFLTERRRNLIQLEDGTYIRHTKKVLERSSGQIYGAFTIAVFGSLVWLMAVSAWAKDWIIWWAVLAVGLIVLFTAARLCQRAKQYYDMIGFVTFVILGSFNFAVVNLRWEKWMKDLSDSGKYLRLTRVPLEHVNLAIAVMMAVVILVFLSGWLFQRRVGSQESKGSTVEDNS